MTWRIWLNNARTWGAGHAPPGVLFNSGGPRSRTRTERLQATVLGESDGCIRSPQVRRLGLAFGDADPVETAWRLLTAEGLHDPEDLRRLFRLPQAPLICRADPELRPAPIARRSRRKALEDLLWLGLCTAWMFDASRPVLWTRASLTRRLEVFEGRGFYA
jgi:hypothetical protein